MWREWTSVVTDLSQFLGSLLLVRHFEMDSPLMKFISYTAVATVLAWALAFKPEYPFVSTLLIAAGPMILWRLRHYGEQVFAIDWILLILALSVIVLTLVSAWLGWLTMPFDRVLRFLAAFLFWSALVALSFRVSFVRADV